MSFILPFPKHIDTYADYAALPFGVDCPDAFSDTASALSDTLCRLFGESSDHAVGIRLTPDPSLPPTSYRLTVTRDAAVIAFSDTRGAACGCAALSAMAEREGDRLLLPVCRIEDAPSYAFRSLMLDVARSFRTLDEIRRYIDLCFLCRLNTLHLHLADGPHFSMYRLPSKAFPRLTSAASYSANDIAELRRYARARGITLLPEIEMPSHAAPLTYFYPDVFGQHENGLICPGKDGVFDALDTLIGEVCELFPDSPYIHVGCDEADYRVWDDCDKCRAYMNAHGIKNAAALYTHTVDRVTRAVLAKGRKPIVWEGFTSEGTEMLSRDITVMVFQSTYQTAPSLVSQGFPVINTSWQPLYIVPSRPKFWERPALYRFRADTWLYEDAVDDSEKMTVTDKNALCGAGMCVWESADSVTDMTILCRTLPVYAERVWSEDGGHTYEETEKAAEALKIKLEALCGIHS